MNYHESIQSVEKKVIPEEMNLIYCNILNCMTRLKLNYSDIGLSDIGSFNNYKNKISSDEKRKDAILQLSSLRSLESDLLERERKLEDKLINGDNLTYEEFTLLTTLKEKRDKISKNKASILKNIHFSNNNVKKFDDKRIDNENEIEKARKDIKKNIEMLFSSIKKLKERNLGLERLEGISVEERHIVELNALIDNYTSKNHIVAPKENIDILFRNSLEIRVNMFKDIYSEAEKIISSYKKQEKIDFQKVNELEALYNTRVWEHPYSIYPDVDKNMMEINNRHLSEYASIVEQINSVTNGELSKEEINGLKLRIYEENLKTDMAHNYLSYKQADFSQYLAYVMERTKEKEVKHTM